MKKSIFKLTIILTILVLTSSMLAYYDSSYSKKLIHAIDSNDHEALNELLDSRLPHNIDVPYSQSIMAYLPLGGDTLTPLSAAVKKGDLYAVQLLLASGADPNACFLSWYCPLREAVDSNNICADSFEIIKELVEAGANVDAIYDWDKTPLLLLADVSMINAEEFQGRATTIVETYKYLERKVINKNPVDDLGNTTLHYAVECRNIKLVKYLIEDENIDINAKNNEGNNALENTKDYLYDEPWEREAYKEIERVFAERGD